MFHREKDAILLSSSESHSLWFQHYENPITNLSLEELEHGCNALWVFEHMDPTVGGAIDRNQPFRLRHGVTGKYVSHRTGQGLTLVTLDEPLALEVQSLCWSS